MGVADQDDALVGQDVREPGRRRAGAPEYGRTSGSIAMPDIYKPVDWSVQQLVDSVGTGVLRLPDLQRPFVWPATKVRDLMDSMYRGYPVGELMFWNRPGDDDTGTIGTAAKSHTSSHQIVDGQQRLTSLYVTIKGATVIDDEYRRRTIRISFNPFLERFEVAQPALDKSAEWVPDVAGVFVSSLQAFNMFKSRLEEVRKQPLSVDEQDRIFQALSHLEGLKSRTFKVVELQPDVEKAVVADIFVRINSEGVNLTAADFILTWLSVFWPEGRDELETFARNSRLTADHVSELTGRKTTWTPKNHYLDPTPGQLVRVAVAVGQRRGRLQDAYNALRARDRKTGATDPKRQADELDKIKVAVPLLLNPLHWDEYLRVLGKAGFRSRKMITSKTTVLYTYALWLIGRTRYQVDITELRDLLARWLFMAQITGRYTSSPETAIQRDMDRLETATDAAQFKATLEAIISSTLTSDYWALRLPDDLVSSSTAASPAYQAYLASLNILDAQLFMLDEHVRDWTDPTATSVKNVEGHHLFPQAYLRATLKLKDIKTINQVANFAPTDWATNNLISDRPPDQYWPDLVKDRSFSGEALKRQMYWHCLPADWTAMDYETFLAERRKLIADVVRAGFTRLGDPTYQPTLPDPHTGTQNAVLTPQPSLLDLMTRSSLRAGDILVATDSEEQVLAEVTDDGEILLEEKTYDTPSRAASSLGFDTADGWDFWAVATDSGTVPLATLRDTMARV